MASSSISVPAAEAVQVLVASLADESLAVRDAAIAALEEIAPLNPILVLNCCSAGSRGGRRRFGNMAGVFTVMACAVRAMDTKDVDEIFMMSLAKSATSEIITSKELNADWQRSAASLLVSIGLHAPDLMMEEVFRHFSGPSSALPAMVQILADFAASEALQFTPRLKDVLSRVLPILGNVRDNQRPIFANAFKCWCQAAQQYGGDFPSDWLHDSVVMSFLNSVFELLLKVWASSRDLKVRLSAVDALGQMVGLITRSQLKAALPRLVQTILDLYRRDQESAFLATCSLHKILKASLLTESGPPLLDFEELIKILCTLIPLACINDSKEMHSDFSVKLKTYNEVQCCFLVIGSVYPEDLFRFLLDKCQQKDEALIVGALCVLKHLLPRLAEAWHSKRTLLVDTAKSLLGEHSLGVQKALAELIVVMASHCYLSGQSGELFVEFLVRHCAISDEEVKKFQASNKLIQKSNSFLHFQYKKLEVKLGPISPAELRDICEKGLLLIAVTIPEMEHVLWPFLLKLIIPRKYTGAIAVVCKCISELCRRRSSQTNSTLIDLSAHTDIPSSVDLFARLVVLLHNPLSREQLPSQILTVLCLLEPLFPKNMSLFWQDEVPKMKSYISDPEDLKQDSLYQETWDDMVINFLAESLDVAQDMEWVTQLGNSFTSQYDLYSVDDEHSALLHRCLGILLQKVDDRAFVRDKIEDMYKHANISVPTNRLGLAKGMGLVAASHLDTVLEKLKSILDNVGRGRFQRFFSFFSGGALTEDVEDIHAALALMYGYAARYAPSSVIEARIDALVGTNMLSRLLHVQHPTAKQAVITAIDLLGNAVINAAETGLSFPLKRRDQMLEYVLTLMGRDVDDSLTDTSLELLHTQSLALSACTTLVSIEPKLPMETRNRVMKATLGFFALPNEPSDIVDPLIDNLITLLCAILVTSGEDGRSRAEQLLHILRQVDQFVSSSEEHQRRRGCLAVYETLQKFRTLCSSGYYGLGQQSVSMHNKQTERAFQRKFSNLPSAFVLPSRDSLSLGERVVSYLPRCADPSTEVRKVAIQIVALFFSIALSLPRLLGAKTTADVDLEVSYTALSSLEDVVSILRRDASIDQSEVFNRVISSVCTLLTKDELVISLHACSNAICDKIKQSAEGTIQAVTEFIGRRGNELNQSEVSRTAQSLLSATVLVIDRHSRQEVLNAISCLAELGRLLKSIGYSGLVFFLLRKFVNYFLGTEQRPTIPYQDKNTENRNQYGNVSEENYLKSHVQDIPKGEFAGKPPYTLVNQAFAVAVRKILEGYLSALNTIFASVKYRRSLKGVDESKFISHNVGSFPSAISEITLLEVYLHTRELRTRIETLGHICGIRINDFAFAEFSTEDFSSRMNLEYSSFPRGADLLTYLYVQLRDADLIHRPLLKFLFLRSYEPYSLFIRSWIFKGRINDPYEEFVVEYSEKASSLCGTSSHCIKEREHASIPRFLKRVCTPLLRAGQQFLVLMKLQDLCNPSAIREDNFGRINLCCDLTSLEDVLPHYSDSSSDSVPSFSLLTFNNKDAEAMLQKRESMYSLLYEKLKIYFEKLDVRFQPIKNTVIPYGDILFYSDEREHVDNQDTSVVENLVSSPSSIDGFTSGDICLKDTDSSSTSDGSLNEMDLEKTSEDSFFTRSEANREFECNFIHDIPVESTNFPALLLQAYHGPERIYRAASTSEKLEALVSSSPRKPEIFVEKYNTSDENDTVNSQGGVNPNMSRFPLRIDAPKCDKNKIVRPFNEDSLFRRPWLLQRLPLNHISANQEYESKSPFLYTETDEIVESHQIENFTAGKRYTLDNLKLDQDARTNTFSDGHVTSAKDFVSHSWTVECNYDLSRNPVIAKAPWLNSLMCSQRSLLPYFDFSSAEDPVQAFSKRLASQSRRVLQDHHHVPMNPVSGHVIRCISDSVPVPQANESGFDSSAPFDGRSYTSHFLGDLSKNVSGGASWERLMMRSCVDVRSNCGGRSCATASTSDLPLDVVIDKCIVQEILHQYVYISNFTIKLLEEGFDLHEHLSALRRYYFMELADWADSFLVSLWNHWSVSEPGNMSAEIQRFLLVALQRSSCESDPYHERLYIYEKDQSVMPSSFSAIGTFDFIGLGYRIDWPISIIVTQDALRVYTEIFSFLLDVRLAVFSLSSMWRSLKALGRSNASGRHLGGQEVENFNIFLGIRQQVNHFVSSLQQYLQSQLSDVSWCRFLISLKQEVNDMLDLESVHMSYLADAQNICFLSAGAREIAKIIRNILQCALDLRACLKASPPETGLDGPDSLTMLDRVNFPRALAVRSAFRKNLRELYLHYLRSPKHSEFSLCRFWCCLDYNGYYSNEISRGTGR